MTTTLTAFWRLKKKQNGNCEKRFVEWGLCANGDFKYLLAFVFTIAQPLKHLGNNSDLPGYGHGTVVIGVSATFGYCVFQRETLGLFQHILLLLWYTGIFPGWVSASGTDDFLSSLCSKVGPIVLLGKGNASGLRVNLQQCLGGSYIGVTTWTPQHKLSQSIIALQWYDECYYLSVVLMQWYTNQQHFRTSLSLYSLPDLYCVGKQASDGYLLLLQYFPFY